VVIVNYQSWDFLRICLAALMHSSLQPEIIVVDNDGSAPRVAVEFPQVIYLPQTENRWFCAGNNIGIRAAHGDYVLLLNPDTIPQPDALALLMNFMEQHPDYRGATVQLRYPDGRIQQTCSRVPTFTYLLLNHTLPGILLRGWRRQANQRHWYSEWGRDTDRDVEVMPGSCLLMRRSDLLLDENLLLYFPEDDLAQRFRSEKFRFLTQSYITHHEKAVTQSWLATKIYYRDLRHYTRTHHGSGPELLLWLLSRPLLWAMALKRSLIEA
jgi:GT2 family glycosyltransferase